MKRSLVREAATAVAGLILLTTAGVSGAAVAAESGTTGTLAACVTSTRNWGGNVVAGYGCSEYALPNGEEQVFGVGTDGAVWTRWSRTNGTLSSWTSLGGQARSSVSAEGYGWAITLSVIGTDGNWWYNNRGGTSSGGWSGWHR
ncbi:hypothetical protein [Streptomyces tanashiensis]|uniref:Uncharacterized protein n=1 Tax=Streptomyces tanashiensis TaxID=67367 RepID=A0ABY6QPU0_9ACTN|nr:hypothetical protein [Streptomyces tanashiensis]UZX19312.1 hypothetical protein LDH80_00470 [Streptomyces tanashiensis]GGY16155.1 hypothetical protein GCM10010299_21140 [Streptomyces tanashiensis]